MSYLSAIILGLIQGLTEFFPVSSSAHLKLAKNIMGLSEIPIIFDLACHLGTLLALFWYFKKEIYLLFSSKKFHLLYFFTALLPLIPSYFLLSGFRKMVSQMEFLGFFLMISGCILFIGQKIQCKKSENFFRDVLWIGSVQSIALIPGISRSGSTITCARILGWEKKDAVHFSFLLAIPTILGGMLVEIRELFRQDGWKESMNIYCFIGFIFAAITGIIVIRFAMRLLERGNLKPFGWYCMIVGAFTIMYGFFYR